MSDNCGIANWSAFHFLLFINISLSSASTTIVHYLLRKRPNQRIASFGNFLNNWCVYAFNGGSKKKMVSMVFAIFKYIVQSCIVYYTKWYSVLYKIVTKLIHRHFYSFKTVCCRSKIKFTKKGFLLVCSFKMWYAFQLMTCTNIDSIKYSILRPRIFFYSAIIEWTRRTLLG